MIDHCLPPPHQFRPGVQTQLFVGLLHRPCPAELLLTDAQSYIYKGNHHCDGARTLLSARDSRGSVLFDSLQSCMDACSRSSSCATLSYGGSNRYCYSCRALQSCKDASEKNVAVVMYAKASTATTTTTPTATNSSSSPSSDAGQANAGTGGIYLVNNLTAQQRAQCTFGAEFSRKNKNGILTPYFAKTSTEKGAYGTTDALYSVYFGKRLGFTRPPI